MNREKETNISSKTSQFFHLSQKYDLRLTAVELFCSQQV